MLYQSKNNRVAIYIRVSTSYQIDKDSLPMQRNDLIAYCNLILNTNDYVIFEDAGYSGKDTARPRYQEMMAQVRQGLFSHILVWKIDRVSRNLTDFASMYQELKNLGVIFVSKNEQFDTSTAMGEAMLKIILVFAELERNMTAERVTATMISRANNGQWNGGRVPYGYDYNYDTKEFSINKFESEIVTLIHNKYEEFRSLVRLSRYLNECGYRTRSGNLWNSVSLLIILKSVFYVGDYKYNVLKEGNRQKVKPESEWVIIENHHPSVVTKDQKNRILKILSSNRRLNNSSRSKHTHIFQGILVCGNCGNPMHSYPSSSIRTGDYSKYSCGLRRKSATSCDGKYTSDPIVGEFIFNYILNMLNCVPKASDFHCPDDLLPYLLIGDTFKHIETIDSDCLADIFDMLKNNTTSSIFYGKNDYSDTSQQEKELSTLRQQKQSLERALDRLTNLFLYSDAAMSESEFVIQKTKLVNSLDEINTQIGFLNSDGWEQSVSDEILIKRASEFIISQKLNGRNYINYKRLAESVDKDILKSFIQNVLDSAIMDKGKIKQIIFRNGLTTTFIYKKPE